MKKNLLTYFSITIYYVYIDAYLCIMSTEYLAYFIDLWKDKNDQYSDKLINIIKNGLKDNTICLIGKEGTDLYWMAPSKEEINAAQEGTRPHIHVYMEGVGLLKKYNAIIKNIRTYYEGLAKDPLEPIKALLGGKATKAKPGYGIRYYGKVNKIKDPQKMAAYTIKDGDIINMGVKKALLEKYKKMGYKKALHCKGCTCRSQVITKQVIDKIISMKEKENLLKRDIMDIVMKDWITHYKKLPTKATLLYILHKTDSLTNEEYYESIGLSRMW